MSDILKKARTAKRESKYVEFKERFDVGSKRDWCEVIKDIVAIANSGGGVILFGVSNDGTSSGFDVTPILNLDSATVTDKIESYTGEQFSGFEIFEISRNRNRVAALQIYGVSLPMIFLRPGTYDVGGGKQMSAFAKGVIVFRHGAKSEPGNSNDLRKVIERELERIRKSWLGNIRKVVNAPRGYSATMLPPEVVESTLPTALPIRLVDDLTAPAYKKMNPDRTHPHRQKEVLKEANKYLRHKKAINSYDILCVRGVYEISKEPQFYYKPRFGSPQYSERFVKWLIDQYEKDPQFFYKARKKYRKS